MKYGLNWGGDHGKNSLKLTLEVANTQNPNSQINTVVIGLVSIKDTYHNLETFLDNGLLNDIKHTHGKVGKSSFFSTVTMNFLPRFMVFRGLKQYTRVFGAS